MPLYQVNAGDRILAADLNQIYALLKGVAASGENVTLIYDNGALTFQPSANPAAGTRVVTIKNNAGTTLASWRYDGLMELLAAATAPATAVAGSAYWDTLISALRINDGTNWRDIAGGSSGPLPNLVLNSDFSRRTVFGLAMPEVFADLSGTTKIDGGAAGSVAANIFTQGAANNEYAWCAGSFVWRDGRASATFKATAIAGKYTLRFRIDATHFISVRNNNGTFELTETQAGVDTVISATGNVLTINRWYWLELELQGTKAIAKIYDTGGTVPGVTKASSTLVLTNVQTTTMSNTGCHVSITSDQAAAQWGGIATGNGGVYVETWLPESNTITFSGTLGGQALGYDESADSGPIGRQQVLTAYCPASSRSITLQTYVDSPTASVGRGTVPPSTAHTFSFYRKVTGASLPGLTLGLFYRAYDNSSTSSSTIADAADTSWTRKTATATSDATTRTASVLITIGGLGAGTARFSLTQLEQGSVATAWRNAPADDAPIVWELTDATTQTTTSGTSVEVNARDLAGNLFLPWDASVTITALGTWSNSGANTNRLVLGVDGSAVGGGSAAVALLAAATNAPISGTRRSQLAAGKHRFSFFWSTTAGTATMAGATAATAFLIEAKRGK